MPVKDTIKDALNAFIQGDNEAAGEAIHDVIAQKMRERINPTPEASIEEIETESDTETEE